MNKMSDEQRDVLNHIKSGSNVVVDACAGSGKSTTILSIAKELPKKSIRQFTYNSMLRHEIKDKTRELNLTNIQVHTYHSFAVKYYSSDAHTDTGIRHLLRCDIKPRVPIPAINILVIDESQDMTFLYFQLIVKMARDSGKRFQLLVLGDYMQGLYEFKGADIRFLTHADQFWGQLPFLLNPKFEKCTLQMSYRITNQMAKFINRDMLGEERLKACRDGCPVIYIRRPRHQIEQIVVYQIRRLLQEGESPSDFFVLGSSVKGTNSNIRRMENILTEHNIPCHVPMFETEAVDERVINGKVVFSTFHSVKGRQRKYVFIVGFDQGYFYNARDLDKSVCPSTIYVGATRATHGLYLLENDSSRPLEFLKHTQYEMKQSDYIDFKGMPQTIFHNSDREDENKGIVTIPTYYVTPTDLIKFVSESVLEEVTPILERIFIVEKPISKEQEIDIPKIVEVRDGLYEDVSDLNGIALPSIYYDLIRGNTDGINILKDMIQRNLQDSKPGSHVFLKQAVNDIPDVCETAEDYLFLANVYVAVQERLYFKLKQIDRNGYNWLTLETVNKCMSCLKLSIPEEECKTSEIEKQLIHHSQESEHSKIDTVLYTYFGYETKFRFTGRVDLLTDSTIWELKCTSQITMDHKMQVVIYMWLWRILYEPETQEKKEFKILNIRTGEQLRVNATLEDLTTIVVALLRNKYGKPVKPTDEEFVSNCREYILADTIFY
jgi:hypothetical protein